MRYTPPLSRNAQSANYEQIAKTATERDSNLELLRILAMMAIIAHHYVVNSTVIQQFTYDNTSAQQYFLEVWGMWGKTAINSFILISGYFMCRMTLTWQRYFKLLIQIFFYGIVIMLVFGATGYQPMNFQIVYKRIFGLLMHINRGFVASFMAFYAFVPIYNKLIDALSKREMQWLVGGLLFVMTVCSTFFFAPTMNEPVWYMTLYFVAAYIRLYPNKYTESLSLSALTLAASVLAAVLIVTCAVYLSNTTGRLGFSMYKWCFVSDSNKLLAFTVGLSAFLTAKNLPKFHSRFINTAAAGTFGVLLIHASSDTMRQWLWQDVCKVPQMLHADMFALVLHALIAPVAIFAICSFIDYFRRQYFEKPIMKRFEGKKASIA